MDLFDTYSGTLWLPFVHFQTKCNERVQSVEDGSSFVSSHPERSGTSLFNFTSQVVLYELVEPNNRMQQLLLCASSSFPNVNYDNKAQRLHRG